MTVVEVLLLWAQRWPRRATAIGWNEKPHRRFTFEVFAGSP